MAIKGKKNQELSASFHMAEKLLGFPPAPLWHINLGAWKNLGHSSFEEISAAFICCPPQETHSLLVHLHEQE